MADEQVDFFVSYAGVDRPWALWISRVLEEAGYRVLVQARDFGAGAFTDAMDDAVRRGQRILPVLSNAYLKSRYTKAEWGPYFREARHLIIPIKVEDVQTRNLLGTQVYINVMNLDEAAAVEHLRRETASLVYPPQGPPREWTGPPAPFPTSATAAERPLAPDRIPLDPGALQLVLLGTHADALRGLADHATAMAPHVLDLAASTLPPTEQLVAVRQELARADRAEVTDVVVAVAGQATVDLIDGICLQLAGADSPLLVLRELLKVLRACAAHRRVVLLLDAAGADDTAVPAPVPVLDLRRPSRPDTAAGGLAGLVAALAAAPAELGARLGHTATLTLDDLATLSGGTLGTPADWTGADIGLLPSPLAWPGRAPDGLPRWCVVLSSADATRADNAVAESMLALGRYESVPLSDDFTEAGRTVALEEAVAAIAAADVFTSPASFAGAVARVCSADIVIFDVTDYEPAVMVLLGIRAAVRRGVSLCVHTPHDEPWREVSAPFHLREISMLTALDGTSIAGRLRAGIRQLTQPEHGYTDLPSFEPLRAVPIERARRGNRPIRNVADPTVLALVPFDTDYTTTNWTHLTEHLPKEAAPHLVTKKTVLQMQRTLDLESPRVVSDQLYEAIRLTDFCLVDLTSTRPNVLFELGVRLAANPLHPIVIIDRAKDATDESSIAALRQRNQLAALLDAIAYTPSTTDLASIGRMVNRHIELLTVDADPERPPQENTLLNGFPPRGVFDLAWRFAAAVDETVTVPVAARIAAIAEGLLANPNAGRVQLLYPPRHPLHTEATRSGREHLIAAWLYQHFRQGGPRNPDAKERKRYTDLTAQLLERLSLETDDEILAFADQVEQWQIDANQPGDER